MSAFATTVLIALGCVGLCRLWLWWRYRPSEVALDEALPGLTVIIPAFDEGRRVLGAIESVLASDYPAERLRVVAVNDGSRDDTGRWLDQAAARWPERVTALHLPANRGKRHALYEGLERAGSEVVATLDSDSVVERGSLRALVSPLTRDAGIAGVAGRVDVDNRRTTLLTRMLAVRYRLGFDFVRAYQSELGTLWCCPGALQAYRREVIAPHLEAWRDQRFLGARCTNGDDHAMTNLVLDLGWRTAYQATAVVRTLVPSSYGRLCRMYIRWGRSATREGLRALAFAPRRALERPPGLPPFEATLMLVDAVLQPVSVFTRALGAPLAVVALALHPAAWLPALLGGLALTTGVALIYAGLYTRSERSWASLWAVAYAWFAVVALPWVQPFATLTVRSNRWMTRG